jgi:hypothetical protein
MGTQWTPKAGDEAYLYPKTMWAPTEAYRTPLVEIVEVVGFSSEARVRLANGKVLTTHTDNLRKTAPTPAAPRAKTLGGRVVHVDPAHGEELTLFDLAEVKGSAGRRAGGTEKSEAAS